MSSDEPDQNKPTGVPDQRRRYPAPTIDLAATEIPKEPAAASTHAPSRDAAGMRDKVLRIQHYCLSEQVAAAVAGRAGTDVHVAAEPHEEALVRLLTDSGR